MFQARYSASDLLAKREDVSQEIKATMTKRAEDFHIILEDVSITNLQFGTDFREAVESKQVGSWILFDLALSFWF